MDGTKYAATNRPTDPGDAERPCGFMDLGPPTTDNNSEQSVTLVKGSTANQVIDKRRASGPRTELGKSKSSRNSLKHGIFSIQLLGEERPTDYQRVSKGISASLQPHGYLEELLVEKVVMLFWRYRRLLQSEFTEICKWREFDDERKLQLDAVKIELEAVSGETREGLMRYASKNPFVRTRCIELLKEWGKRVRPGGSQFYGVLTRAKLFGKRSAEEFDVELRNGFREPEPHPPTIPNAQPPDANSALRENKQYIDATTFIDDQLKILGQLEERTKCVNGDHEKTLPPAEISDRLIRYEVHLNRELDRTLSQLERLQRIRLGQSVPSPIKVDISS